MPQFDRKANKRMAWSENHQVWELWKNDIFIDEKK